MAMRLLILGGTHFLGRHAAEEAIRRGYDLTLFNRGRSAPELFPEAERLQGDRDGGLEPLRDREFDAVLDTSRVRPARGRPVGRAAARRGGPLRVRVQRVRVRHLPPGRRGGRGRTAARPAPRGRRGGHGALRRPEGRLRARGPDRVRRRRRGGPPRADRRVRTTPPTASPTGCGACTRRPTASPSWRPRPPTARCSSSTRATSPRGSSTSSSAGTTGVFNADGPAAPITMAEALGACAFAAGTTPQVEWVDEAFLLEHKVEPWMGLPLWIPEDDPEGLAVFDNRRAVAAGLTFRPPTRRPPTPWPGSWRGRRARWATCGPGIPRERERRAARRVAGAHQRGGRMTESTVDRGRLASLMERERGRFVDDHPRSAELFERGKGSLPRRRADAVDDRVGRAVSRVRRRGRGRAVHRRRRPRLRRLLPGRHRRDDRARAEGGDRRPSPRRPAKGITLMLPTEDSIWVGQEMARRFGLPYWQFCLTATDANRFTHPPGARRSPAGRRSWCSTGATTGRWTRRIATLDDTGAQVDAAGQRRPAGRPGAHDARGRVQRPRRAGEGAGARGRRVRAGRAGAHQHRHRAARAGFHDGAARADPEVRDVPGHRRDALHLRRAGRGHAGLGPRARLPDGRQAARRRASRPPATA